MYRTAVTGKAALAAEEARMARAAAIGDGGAFAALYERYEQRACNLAYRTTGSEADAADAVQEAFLDVMRRLPRLGDHELAFGPCLFTATRNAGYDLISRRPGETTPEFQQEDIREASMRLPKRQREVLALRDLEELSYDEIGAIMDVNGNTVSQLISRARINLSDEMRGTTLASVAAPSAECERALPLIATRDDGQLEAASRDAAWLDAHLADCHRCRLGVEAMREADASYRAWAPITAVPWLLKETMANAAELVGADWSEAIADAAAARTPAGSLPGMPSAYLTNLGRGNSSRHRMTLAAGLAALLLLAGVAAAVVGTAPRLSVGAAKFVELPAKAGKTKGGAAMKKATTRTTAAAKTTGAGTTLTPVQVLPTEGSAPSEPASHPPTPGKTAVDPTRQTSAPKHSSKPAPAPTPAPQPTAAPAPAAAAQEAPPAEELPAESRHGHEPPGKPPPHTKRIGLN